MKIKEGAVMNGLNIKMRIVLKNADEIWKDHGQELVITEGTGGTHSAGSLHYYGYAVDLRTNYFSASEISSVVQALKEELCSDYDVVFEGTHIHVEYNKAKEL